MFVIFKQRLMLVLLVATFILPCHAATPKLHERLSGKILEIFKKPKYVTLSTLPVEGEFMTTRDVHLKAEEIERLKTNLLDDHNYDFGARRPEGPFQPAISFKFEDDQGQILYLFVCFKRQEILFAMKNHSVFVNYSPVHQRLEYFFQGLTGEILARNI